MSETEEDPFTHAYTQTLFCYCVKFLITPKSLLPSFHRFLYQELKKFCQSGPGTLGSIFMRRQGSRLLAVRPGITFHLYMNSAPQGDAVRFLSE